MIRSGSVLDAEGRVVVLVLEHVSEHSAGFAYQAVGIRWLDPLAKRFA